MEKIQERSFWPIIKIEGFPAIYYKVRTIELVDYPYIYEKSDWYFLDKPITSYLVVEIDDLSYLKELDLLVPAVITEEDSLIIDLESKNVYINETEAIGYILSINVNNINRVLKEYKTIYSIDYNFNIIYVDQKQQLDSLSFR